jgi:hypothetical protein
VATYTALLDACVLYPAPLRDLLLWLASTGCFQAKWSDAIHDEWISGALRDRPELSPERLARTRRLMDQAVREYLVSGHEASVDALELPDWMNATSSGRPQRSFVITL